MGSITFNYNTAVFESIACFFAGAVETVVRPIAGYVAKVRAERALRRLDERMLGDIGVERADIHTIVWGAAR